MCFWDPVLHPWSRPLADPSFNMYIFRFILESHQRLFLPWYRFLSAVVLAHVAEGPCHAVSDTARALGVEALGDAPADGSRDGTAHFCSECFWNVAT